MSKHKTHNCKCDHTTVEYCKTCRLVHCLDCNQEWTARANGNWYYPYYAQQGLNSTSNLGSLGQGGTTFTKGLDNQLNDGHTVTVTSTATPDCKHTS